MSESREVNARCVTRLLPLAEAKIIRRTADIDSGCRFSLTRDWSNGEPPVWLAIVGLNPSIADGEKDDPTMRRDMDFAARLGATALVKVNLVPFVATDPRHMVSMLPVWRTASVEQRNDKAIQAAAALARGGNGKGVLVAWGVVPKPIFREERRVCALLGTPIMCLGTTKDGHPRHTLYLPKTACPQEWTPRAQ